MFTFSFIARLLATIFGACFWTYFYCATLKPRWTKKISYLGMLGVTILIVTPFCIYFDKIYFLKISFTYIVEYLFLFLFFKDSALRITVIKILQIILFILTEIFSAISTELLFKTPSGEAITSPLTGIVGFYCIFVPATILFFIFGAKITNKLMDKCRGIPIGNALRFAFFPLSQLLILFYLAFLIMFKASSIYGGYLVAFIICILASIVADILLIRIVRDTAKKAQLETANLYLEKQKELQLQHYQAFVEQQEETRKLRHDIMNHVQTIKLLIAQQETEEADMYADKLAERFGKITTVDYCDNKIIDAVLHNKVEYANSLGINSNIVVAVDTHSSINDLDLMAVFSNLLDNAIHAAEKAEGHKYFSLTTGEKGGYLMVKMENSGDGSPIQPAEKSKEKAQNHGLGLKILQEITEKYDGSLRLKQNGTTYETTLLLRQEAKNEG